MNSNKILFNEIIWEPICVGVFFPTNQKTFWDTFFSSFSPSPSTLLASSTVCSKSSFGRQADYFFFFSYCLAKKLFTFFLSSVQVLVWVFVKKNLCQKKVEFVWFKRKQSDLQFYSINRRHGKCCWGGKWTVSGRWPHPLGCFFLVLFVVNWCWFLIQLNWK